MSCSNLLVEHHNLRAPQACDRCQRKRIRCEKISNQLECSACRLKGEACNFTTTPKKRGPRRNIPGYKPSPTPPKVPLKKQIQFLVDAIKAQLEWQVGYFLTRTTRDLAVIVFLISNASEGVIQVGESFINYLKTPITKSTVAIIYALACHGSALLLKSNGQFHTVNTGLASPLKAYNEARLYYLNCVVQSALDQEKLLLANHLLKKCYKRLARNLINTISILPPPQTLKNTDIY